MTSGDAAAAGKASRSRVTSRWWRSKRLEARPGRSRAPQGLGSVRLSRSAEDSDAREQPHRCRRRGGNPHDGEIAPNVVTDAFGCSRRLGLDHRRRALAPSVSAGMLQRLDRVVRRVFARARPRAHFGARGLKRHGDAGDGDGADEFEGIGSAVSASGVPATRTSMFIGTLSGCSGKVAKVWISPIRSARSDAQPTIPPPQQTLMPASRT